MASTRLDIKQQTAIEWARDYVNPNGTGKYEACISGRPTEEAATQRSVYGNLIPATNSPRHINGQLADLNTQLYCSVCHTYLFDNQFERDKTRISRRGRAYTCKSCKRKTP